MQAGCESYSWSSRSLMSSGDTFSSWHIRPIRMEWCFSICFRSVSSLVSLVLVDAEGFNSCSWTTVARTLVES